jgi:protein-disulfide isomerase
MLVIGLLGGFFGQPLLSSSTNPVAAQISPSTNSSSVPFTAPTPDATLATQQQELMKVVIENTRHFRGDPNAPVTIIEFSDFQ